MTDTHVRFRDAALAGDLEAVRPLLADDVVFRSPSVHKPYEGIDAVLFLLGHVIATFEDFRYVDELTGPDSAALVFEARVGDRELQGVDHLRLGAGRPDRRAHGDGPPAVRPDRAGRGDGRAHPGRDGDA